MRRMRRSAKHTAVLSSWSVIAPTNARNRSISVFSISGIRQSRRACCEREVELNRRLAPDVYLGVAELQDPDAGTGEPLVLMRRMPDARRLSTLLRSRVNVSTTLSSVSPG